MLDPDIQAHYERGVERPRLTTDVNLELVRSRDILRRHLSPPPASVLDVGGGPGTYAAWLAAEGYRVHLIDPVPRHIAEAEEISRLQPGAPFTVAVGDARRLDVADATYDAVLLMGPLYHLTDRAERLSALAEARRVVRPGGPIVVAAISRFASLLDGLRSGWLADPAFAAIVEQDLRTGQHRNPRPDTRPEWFTTAYFHRPDELAEEIAAANLVVEALIGVEGPGWLIWQQGQNDPEAWSGLLDAARAVETEPSVLGVSAHLLAVARR